MDPSTTRTNGSNSPRSALKNHSRKSSAPPVGPHSKSIRGQWTAIFGRPGSAPSAISSMLGWVAAVNATESPSQLNPALIHRTWINASSALTAASLGMRHSFLGAGLASPSQEYALRPLLERQSSVYSRANVLSTGRWDISGFARTPIFERIQSYHASSPSPLVAETGKTATPGLTDRA